MSSQFYPPWWNQTITIYNKYTDSLTQVVTWHRTVITNCFWKNIGDKINVGTTTLETNNIICRIPKQSKFLERYKWVQLTNDEMSKYFTLGVGDIIVRDSVSDEIDEYTKGKHSNDIIAKYKQLQGCMEIQEVGINIDGERNNEHYYVKGV